MTEKFDFEWLEYTMGVVGFATMRALIRKELLSREEIITELEHMVGGVHDREKAKLVEEAIEHMRFLRF